MQIKMQTELRFRLTFDRNSVIILQLVFFFQPTEISEMNIYEAYNPRTIRNKSNPDALEAAYVAMKAQDAADRLISKYRSEPGFLLQVTGKLIERIKEQALQK
jgi:hypothetical protein